MTAGGVHEGNSLDLYCLYTFAGKLSRSYHEVPLGAVWARVSTAWFKVKVRLQSRWKSGHAARKHGQTREVTRCATYTAHARDATSDCCLQTGLTGSECTAKWWMKKWLDYDMAAGVKMTQWRSVMSITAGARMARLYFNRRWRVLTLKENSRQTQ